MRLIQYADLVTGDWSLLLHQPVLRTWTILPSKRYYSSIMASERTQRRIDSLLDEAEEAIANLDWPVVQVRAQAVFLLPNKLLFRRAMGIISFFGTSTGLFDSTNNDQGVKLW